jgi:hypothetical protein
VSRQTIEIVQSCWEFNRERTLGLLQQAAGLPQPAEALGWRAAPGRAHVAWQLLHIGMTEELFATERILGTPPAFADLVPRFRGGSTPDDEIPPVDRIRDVLNATREHVLETFSSTPSPNRSRNAAGRWARSCACSPGMKPIIRGRRTRR